jgi:putative transposase
VYFNVRGEEARECLLVIVGVTEQGTKELVAIEDGFRESEQSWLELLTRLKHQGLKVGPNLATGDGALGLWKALAKVYGQTRHQRCWVHKTANVLNKLPKSLQPKAKSALHQIWMAESRDQAEKAFDTFIATYRDKYPRRHSVWRRTARNCSPSTTFRPCTGSTSALPTPSSRLSPR